MSQSRRDLPPLGALVAFEAAAKHLSFTAAAAELCLSQAAISKQIRLLEADLGQQLFSRAHRRVELTADGRAFLHVVVQSLGQIASAAHELREPADEEPARICASHTFAFLWLSPMLPDFFERHPQARLDLLVLEESTPRSDVDLIVTNGDGSWSGYESVCLGMERVTPVCSPGYLRQIGGLPDPASLIRANLLELDDAQPSCSTWRTWLTANNVPFGRHPASLRCDSYPLLIQAARDGLGVALGLNGMIGRFLEDGSLVQPMPHIQTADTEKYVLSPAGVPLKGNARLFRDWLAGHHGVGSQVRPLPV